MQSHYLVNHNNVRDGAISLAREISDLDAKERLLPLCQEFVRLGKTASDRSSESGSGVTTFPDLLAVEQLPFMRLLLASRALCAMNDLESIGEVSSGSALGVASQLAVEKYKIVVCHCAEQFMLAAEGKGVRDNSQMNLEDSSIGGIPV